ncbi:MAG: DUF4347 domain-containing protein [Pleurocapsa sp.]
MSNDTSISLRTSSTASKLVFIDSQVENYQSLVAGVVPETEVIILSAKRDGIAQISEVVRQRQLSEIHIVSHGSPGCLYLGNSQLSLDTLDQYQADLKSWFSPSPYLPVSPSPYLPISPSPRLLIYGCNVAAGDAGEEFIAKLHEITGAEIAASATRTGNAALGGDWNLEVTTGNLAVSLAFEQETLDNYSFVLPVFNNVYYGVFASSSNIFDQLRTVDLTNGTSTPVTNSTTLFQTVALSREGRAGRLYYIERIANNGRVAYYDTLTGTHTQVGTTGINNTLIKMAQAQDGTIWAAGGDNVLYTINPGTGAATLAYTMPSGTFPATAASGDMAFDPNNPNILYITRGPTTAGANIDLYRININPTDPSLSTTTLVGNTGQSATSSGSLAFGNDGLLYSSSSSNLIRIDTSTGVGTVVASNIGSFGDFATLPIPEANPANAPVANNDSYEVVRNGSINVRTTTNGILTNDTDPNGDTLTILSVTQPTNGTVTFNDNQTPFDSSDDTVTYTPTTGFTGTDAFTYTVGDGKGGYSTATVNIKVNAPPVIDLDGNNSSGATGNNYQNKFSFNGSAVAIADTDTIITDADDTNIESATITLTNRPNGTDEALAVLGTLPTGITASAYDPATGVITLTGSATLANYQTAIAQITYNNTAGVVGRVTGDRTVNVVVNDGNANSNTAISTISVSLLDNAIPVLDLDGDDSSGATGNNYQTTFTEKGMAVSIGDTDISITDADDTNIESATIILTNFQAGDLLAVTGSLPTGITASAYNTTTGVITLIGGASLANYQDAIRAITFNNTSNNPSTTPRNVDVVVNDGNNNSNTATTTINITPVNDPPVLDLDGDDSSGAAGANYQTTFTEGGGSVSIGDTDVSITDPDNTNIESATITLTNFQADDLLAAGSLPAGITASAYDPATGILTLSGSATLADYQAAIEAISFENTSNNPDTSDRTVSVVVNDGTSNSNTATSTIQVFNRIDGTSGSDDLTSESTSGNDLIVGYEGQDTLTGGAGSNRFLYTQTSDGIDIITDFDATGADKLVFSDIINGELDGITFSANAFDDGYIEAVAFGTGVMIQVNVNPADSLENKNVVLLKNDVNGISVGDIDASDFIF